MFKKYFSLSLKKTILIISLIPISWFFEKSEFPKIDAFIRDAFQYLNDPSEVDKSLVTININAKNDDFKRPFDLEETWKPIIEKIRAAKPKYIILSFTVSEFSEKQKIFDYLSGIPNLYLQVVSILDEYDPDNDLIFKNFNQRFYFSGTYDELSGPGDKKQRRIILNYNAAEMDEDSDDLPKVDLKSKPITHFKHSFTHWNTQQIYFKNYKQTTFGSYDAIDLINNKLDPKIFKDKVVILGAFDEYSFLCPKSIFNLLGSGNGIPFRKAFFPSSDLLANMINTLTQGDYIKVIDDFRDIPIIFISLIILILLNTAIQKKIYIFISLIPVIILTSILLYILTSFYLDFSRSIAMLIALQYFAIPIVMLNIFKEQETKKLQEINDARIDALLTISEKVAHDIRSPLSAINLVMSRAKFEDQQFKEVFDGAVKRIDETATKILQKYRTNHNNNEHNHAIVILPIIDKIIKEKTILNNKIQIVLSNNLSNTSALGSSLDIERIISNIIDNSLYALKEQAHPKIQITITTDNEYLIIDLKDNGVGIPERILNIVGHERVTTKSENNEGNGIGLLHAKRTIEQMDGRFLIDSKVNLGTTIRIYLKKA